MSKCQNNVKSLGYETRMAARSYSEYGEGNSADQASKTNLQFRDEGSACWAQPLCRRVIYMGVQRQLEMSF
jgi:hypothetical protein